MFFSVQIQALAKISNLFPSGAGSSHSAYYNFYPQYMMGYFNNQVFGKPLRKKRPRIQSCTDNQRSIGFHANKSETKRLFAIFAIKQNHITMDISKQKEAGALGRRQGHNFEIELAEAINKLKTPFSADTNAIPQGHYVFKGDPAELLIKKILNYYKSSSFKSIIAHPTGRLATAEEGEKVIIIDGQRITKAKSDIILEAIDEKETKRIIGISVKQCNKPNPTNDQVFFTTASAFCNLLKEKGLEVSEKAWLAMKQFCGDAGFTPRDNGDTSNRKSNPERYFWEEVNKDGRDELEKLFKEKQDEITRLLLQKGYSDDPFPPDFIIHKTRKAKDGITEVALFSMDEIIKLSHDYASFNCVKYRVKKGRYKEPKEIEHHAPRFGVIQMQRCGNKQNATQLQFNLKAGYFYEFEPK